MSDAGGYLTWLADELRAAGLVVAEMAGWQTRARRSGGFLPGRPWCVMWHHTASAVDPSRDAAWMMSGSPDRPICNVLITRQGEVWVLAAGATNTNGKGMPCVVSKGTIPADSMNSYAFGMELANNGTGEPFPEVQIDAAFTTSNVVNRKLGNLPTDVCTHQEYAPTRKVDPATASAVQGRWQPRSVNKYGSWSLADLRAECGRRSAGGSDMTPEQAEQLRWVYDRLRGASPGPESGREPVQPERRYFLDNSDGDYLAKKLDEVLGKLDLLLEDR